MMCGDLNRNTGFIMVGEDRYRSAEVIRFRNGSDEFLDCA
jgi:hypothetical protein